MNKRIFIYIAIIYVICFGLGIIGLKSNKAYELLATVFTAVPLLALLITRIISKDKSCYNCSIKVWKNLKTWAMCLFLPNVTIILGAVLYYATNSGDFNTQVTLTDFLSIFGIVSNDATLISPIIAILVTVILSILLIPIHLLELGEELGWRGYLLPLQIQKYGVRKAVLLNGFLWGVAHAPLIYFGSNYSLSNPLAPYSNIALMIVFCIVVGIIESYVTIKTGNCMYAAILHGVINLTGEIPICFSLSKECTLLGPNPSGFIGMIGLIAVAIFLFFRVDKLENKLAGDFN